MKYRVMICLVFDNEGRARGLYNHALNTVEQASPLDDDSISWHRCTHDEPDNGPCEVIEEWHPS